jgi:hypothetical protein
MIPIVFGYPSPPQRVAAWRQQPTEAPVGRKSKQKPR